MTKERLLTLITRAFSIDDLCDTLLAEVDYKVREDQFKTLHDAVNQCEAEACKAKYQEVAQALHVCECGKPQQFIAEKRNGSNTTTS